MFSKQLYNSQSDSRVIIDSSRPYSNWTLHVEGIHTFIDKVLCKTRVHGAEEGGVVGGGAGRSILKTIKQAAARVDRRASRVSVRVRVRVRAVSHGPGIAASLRCKVCGGEGQQMY
ncbi:hypothetical protein J6590_054559 [Homalodisca vitripennis]|nr:hypothetical protein J6590_054559 [Homalodisca vitripennis]